MVAEEGEEKETKFNKGQEEEGKRRQEEEGGGGEDEEGTGEIKRKSEGEEEDNVKEQDKREDAFLSKEEEVEGNTSTQGKLFGGSHAHLTPDDTIECKQMAVGDENGNLHIVTLPRNLTKQVGFPYAAC